MRRQGYYATHIIPYHTVASKDTHTYTAGEHSYYESLTTNVYETVAAWQKTMAFVPSAKDGSQMTSSFLPVGHTDRHEVSFEHRNDICFWANDNYPVPCILHSIYPSRLYLCHWGFTAYTMLRSYAAIAITYS